MSTSRVEGLLKRTFLDWKLSLEACRRRDGRYSISHLGGRLDLYVMPIRGIVMESSLLRLPREGTKRAARLRQALAFSVKQMTQRHDVLTTSHDGLVLVLQHEMDECETSRAIEAEIVRFMAAVDRWRQVMGREEELNDGRYR